MSKVEETEEVQEGSPEGLRRQRLVCQLYYQLHGDCDGIKGGCDCTGFRCGDYVLPSASLKAWVTASCCRRYLAARQWDLAKAYTMLVATLQWRVKFFGGAAKAGNEAITTMDVDMLRSQMKSGKMFVHPGRDRVGRPIVVNVKSKVRATDHKGGMRMVVYNLERAAMAADACASKKWVWIIDLADYTRANSPPQAITRETLSIMSNHYPERLWRCFVIDAPTTFRWLWAGIKFFIDSVTASKLHFISNGASHTSLPLLSEVIAPETLLARFGGGWTAPYDFEKQDLPFVNPAAAAPKVCGTQKQPSAPAKAPAAAEKEGDNDK